MDTTFRQVAERRVAELEQRDADRKVRAEQRAAEQRAGQAAERDRRDQARQAEAAQQAAEARARLARRYGIASAPIVLHGEYYAFTCPARDVLVAISRPAGSTSRDSWRHQRRLQEQLGVGLAPPAILVGAQLVDAADDVDRLVVDPSAEELANLTGRGTAT